MNKRAFDRAVKKWRKATREGGDTLPYFIDVLLCGPLGDALRKADRSPQNKLTSI